LLRLIARLPEAQRTAAFKQAHDTTRQRKDDTNPENCLAYLKEMAARIGYLRIVTPKRHGDVASAIYVMRDGKLVEGQGEDKGARVATGVIGHDEAMRKNAQHFKRLYGADKPKSMFF